MEMTKVGNSGSPTLGDHSVAGPKISIHPEGDAMATNSLNRLYVPGNLYNDALEFSDAVGQLFITRPVGLVYADNQTRVLVAQITETSCLGGLGHEVSARSTQKDQDWQIRSPLKKLCPFGKVWFGQFNFAPGKITCVIFPAAEHAPNNQLAKRKLK